jgi:translocon-associated protein subunit alpha
MAQSFQNLSVVYLADLLEANQQASFTYKFVPSARFEPADFGFVLEVSFKGEL